MTSATLKVLLASAAEAEVSMKASKAEYGRNRSEKNLNWWKVANREWNRIWSEIQGLPR